MERVSLSLILYVQVNAASIKICLTPSEAVFIQLALKVQARRGSLADDRAFDLTPSVAVAKRDRDKLI